MNDAHEEQKLPCSDCDRCLLSLFLSLFHYRHRCLFYPCYRYVAGNFGQKSNELPMLRATLTKRFLFCKFISIKIFKNHSSGGISPFLSLL